MEFNSNADYFSIHPPRLEDAGLEDAALPLEGIQEAFQRAAESVKLRTASLRKSNDADCRENPGPSWGEWEDSFVDGSTDGECVDAGSYVETQTGGIKEQGHDAVIDIGNLTEEDRLLVRDNVRPKLGGGCVDNGNVKELLLPDTEKGDQSGAKDLASLDGAYLPEQKNLYHLL